MATYIDKRQNAFRDAMGDGSYNNILPKRSDSRLKDHGSCVDMRAWGIADEQRRLYLIDLIRATPVGGKGLGKYIPVEVIIDLLVAEKNKEIARLTQKITEYENIYGTLESASDGRPYSSSTRGRTGEFGPTTTSTRSDTSVSSTPFVSGLDELEDTAITEYIWENEKMDEAGVNALKKQLVALSQELKAQRAISIAAVKMLESLRQIVESKDSGMKQLMPSQKQDTSLEPCNLSDILAIKEAIEVISTNHIPGLDKDPEVIAQKLADLRACCLKLTKIVEENEKLKNENEFIRNQLMKIPVDENAIETQYAPLQQRLTSSIEEMNTLKEQLCTAKAQVLESKDVVVWRERSEMLDDVIVERDSLKRRLEKLAGLEEQVQRLKKRAEEADALEEENYNLMQEIRELQKYRRISDFQEQNLESLRLEQHDASRSLEHMRAERDQLARKVTEKAAIEESLRNLQEKHRLCACVKEERDALKAKMTQYGDVDDELKTLRAKAEEAKFLKMERDRLQKKVQELSTIQMPTTEKSDAACKAENPDKSCKTNRSERSDKGGEFQQLKEENNLLRVQRNSLKRQIQDLECVVSDQEDEIKALILHIEHHTRELHTEKETIKSAFGTMRAEIKRQNALLNSSQLKLVEMENINSNMNEMQECYKRALANMKRELSEKQSLINILQQKLEANVIEASSQLVKKMSTELEAARKENNRAEELITEIKRMCYCKQPQMVITETRRVIDCTLQNIQEQNK